MVDDDDTTTVQRLHIESPRPDPWAPIMRPVELVHRGSNWFSKISHPGEPAPELAGSVQQFEVQTLVLDQTLATLSFHSQAYTA